ncbi:hypothetical protein [Burkholderia cenocepacia]|uniref:hypothetical protein n=1 Tax=Burkholderia cenocepacia TaxID=95486 RepID=UPI000F5A865E|nr:hypothetical protein [Burkholderia cenocepacia]
MSELIVRPDTAFELDDRRADRLLEELEAYVEQLPTDMLPRGASWSTIFFGDHPDITRQRLMKLMQVPASADGQLPAVQAFVLTMLRLLETPRELLNRLPEQYRDLYYRNYLGLTERAALPDQVVISATLADSVREVVLPCGTMLDGGQDSAGTSRIYRLDESYSANHAEWTDLRWSRPEAGGGKRIVRVLFDTVAGQAWPESGIRMFSPAPKSVALKPPADRDRIVAFAPKQRWAAVADLIVPSDWNDPPILTVRFRKNIPDDLTGLSAAVSTGSGWVSSVEVKKAADAKTVSFTFAKGLAPAPATNLDGLTTQVPLLCITVEDPTNEIEQVHFGNAQPLTPSEQGCQTLWGYSSNVSEQADMFGHDDELYIGVRAIEPGQILRLHWQVRSPQAVDNLNWCYLAHNGLRAHWVSLNHQMVDQTLGWQTSGVWSVTWPEDALDTADLGLLSQCMPPGRFWLRVRAKRPEVAPGQFASMPVYPWLIGMCTNAVSATLENPDEIVSGEIAKPLAPQSILGAIAGPSGLADVTQPWPSVGARAAETREDWIARIANRLRHRERALNDWDIDALLREQFPQIQALRVAESRVGRSIQHRTAQAVVLMPHPTDRDNDDPLRPAFSQAHLDAMGEWIKARASCWLQLVCVNPTYVPVSIAWEVDFQAGISPNLGHQQIRDALTEQLLDWTREGATRNVIGLDLPYSTVFRLVKGCGYVRRVKSLALNGQRASQQAGAAEVLVPVFGAPVYDAVRLSIGQAVDALDEPQPDGGTFKQWQQATIYGNAANSISVDWQLPSTWQECAITEDMIYLYDCETGERLNETLLSTGTLAFSRTCPTSSMLAVHVAHEIPQVNPEGPTLKGTLYLIASEAVGVYRIGLGVDVDREGQNISLRSHDVGIELAVTVMRRIDYAKTASWQVDVLPSVELHTGKNYTATLDTYVIGIAPVFQGHRSIHLFDVEKISAVKKEVIEQYFKKESVGDHEPHAVTHKGNEIRFWWIAPPQSNTALQPPGSKIEAETEVEFGVSGGTEISVDSTSALGMNPIEIGTDLTFLPMGRAWDAQSVQIYAVTIRLANGAIATSIPQFPLKNAAGAVVVSDDYGHEATVCVSINSDSDAPSIQSI